jgi:hypothetical protein
MSDSTQSNTETTLSGKEVFEAAEAIVAYLENFPHNPPELMPREPRDAS